MAIIWQKRIPQESGDATDKRFLETIMQNNIEHRDTTGFSFRLDMLHLNLHLAESEKSPEPQTRIHETALAQMLVLVGQS